MQTQVDLAPIHATALRCKAEGIPISEGALRRFIKTGTLPAVWTGKKALVYWPNITRFVEQGNNARPEPPSSGIRRLEA